MDDPDRTEATEFPCPLCGDPTHTSDEPCEPCKLERKAREDAAATAAKYPPLPPFTGMGSGMP